MSVLNISTAQIKDPESFGAYITAAAALMKSAGVEVVLRGEYDHTKRGPDVEPHIIAAFRFADMEAAKAFYGSAEYEEILPLRDQGCDMTVRFYHEK